MKKEKEKEKTEPQWIQFQTSQPPEIKMGKTGKKLKNQRIRKDASYYLEGNEQPSNPLTHPTQSDSKPSLSDEEQDSDPSINYNDDNIQIPSKFSLYQQSVQVKQNP